MGNIRGTTGEQQGELQQSVELKPVVAHTQQPGLTWMRGFYPGRAAAMPFRRPELGVYCVGVHLLIQISSKHPAPVKNPRIESALP